MRTEFPQLTASPRLQGLAGRFECKYVVDPVLLAPIRQFVRAFAAPDPLAAACPDRRYQVCSLYLDTSDLHFYRQYVSGERSRFKLRARTYSDDPDAPVFLEVKWRVNRLVFKQRAVVSREEARDVLEGRAGRATAPRPAGCQRGLDAFTTDRALTAARPVVRVKYRREAYVSAGPEPVRVTFDTDTQFQPTFGATLSHAGSHWTPAPLGGVVVEVKFHWRLPGWAEDMIRTFALVQRPCCKYAVSIERAASNGGCAALLRAGFRLPAEALRAAS